MMTKKWYSDAISLKNLRGVIYKAKPTDEPLSVKQSTIDPKEKA